MIYHQCLEQENIATEKREPTGMKPKCRCRQEISPEVGAALVKNGDAKFVVLERTYAMVDVLCSLCRGNELFVNCAHCKDKRTIKAKKAIEKLGTDIVAVQQDEADKKNKRKGSAVAVKTPRTQTIEKAHIERVIEGRADARERLEAYGRMIKEVTASLVVGFEPPDDPKTMTGRRYDYGRAVLYSPKGDN